MKTHTRRGALSKLELHQTKSLNLQLVTCSQSKSQSKVL